MNYFSVYSLVSNKEAIAKEERDRPLKTKYIPHLKRDLKTGWLFPHLYHHDALLHGRWEYWHRLQLVSAEKFPLLQEPDPEIRLASIREHILPKEPIPPITFGEGGVSSRNKGQKMLEICLDKMLTKGGYTSLLTRIEYFLDCYWGNLIVEAKGKGSQKHTGYFPTPKYSSSHDVKNAFWR